MSDHTPDTPPATSAEPDPADERTERRAVFLAQCEEDLHTATGGLLAGLHDVDVHYYSDAGLPTYPGAPTAQEIAGEVLDRADAVIVTARVAIDGAVARRGWLTAGGVLRCALGGGFLTGTVTSVDAADFRSQAPRFAAGIWNRPHDVHTGAAAPLVPSFPEPESLPTT